MFPDEDHANTRIHGNFITEGCFLQNVLSTLLIRERYVDITNPANQPLCFPSFFTIIALFYKARRRKRLIGCSGKLQNIYLTYGVAKVRDLLDSKGKDIVSIDVNSSVDDAIRSMNARKISAIMVTEQGKTVGIFTERDAVFRVMARGLDARTTRLADVMTTSPRTVDPDKPFGYALLVMHEHGFRHLPVIENGKPIGIVSARSAMDPDLEEFISEAQRRKHYGERP
jgi:CBS domain-containing protein